MPLFPRRAGDHLAAAEELVEAAERELDTDDPETALRHADNALREARRAEGEEAVELQVAALVLRASALNDCERFGEAEAAAAEACELDAEEPAAWYERAVAAYRRGRMEDAERWYRAAVALEPGDAPSWHGLGRALLWQGRRTDADAALTQAASLEPDHFVRPVRIAGGEFDRIAAAAWQSIPATFRAQLSNATVVVQELPDLDEVEEGFDPDTLGVYEGATALSSDLPERIVIFQRNHESVCGSLGELSDEIRRTILHEVGHHFGMDEHELPY